MMIELPTDDIKAQSIAAGFASVEDYVRTLLDRDGERIAIEEGIDSMNAGRMRSWEDVDRNHRLHFGFPPRT